MPGALSAGAGVTVIGGGLIGLEVASSARRLGAPVTVVEAAPLPLGGLLGREVGLRLAAWHREDGADLRIGAELESARGGHAGGGGTAERRVEEIELADGSRLATDHVVVAVGVRPGAAWLEGSGLDPRGIPTGEGGRTAPPSFWSDQLGLRLQCIGAPAGARAMIAADADGRGFDAVYRRYGRISAVLLAGRSAADLRAARRLLIPEPRLERSAA